MKFFKEVPRLAISKPYQYSDIIYKRNTFMKENTDTFYSSYDEHLKT